MSDHERPRSRSASRSPRQDSWYTLVQEEILVSSPSPSPRRSGSSSGSRASSKASSVSSTPKLTQHLTTSSAAAGADDHGQSLLQSTTLSQHPLDEDSAILSQYPLKDDSVLAGGKSMSASSLRRLDVDVISPLGAQQDDKSAAGTVLDIPLLNLDASLDSQDGAQFKSMLATSMESTGVASPFVEEDDSAVMSSDTDIPIPLSDDEVDGPGYLEEGGLTKDAVQEAIAEVSADFVSGVLSMSVSQHSLDGDKAEDKSSSDIVDGNMRNVTTNSQEVQSSAATTPWQSETGGEQATPSPNMNLMTDQILHEDHSSHPGQVSSSLESSATRSSKSSSFSAEVNTVRSASQRPTPKPSSEDLTRGSPNKLPLDLDSLQPLDIQEHVAAGADVVIVRGSAEDFAPENQVNNSIKNVSLQQKSVILDEISHDASNRPDNQIHPLEGQSRESLPSQYLSPSEGNTSRDAQAYIQYPADLHSSPNLGFSSDTDSNKEMQDERSRSKRAREMNESHSQRREENERDLLARRVALLLQVNSDTDFRPTRSGSLPGSLSSSHTGSPDSIEEANLPPGILQEAYNLQPGQRRGDGQSLPRSESNGSSSTDSLAEHVRRLLLESESLRKLHEAGIDPQQLLTAQSEMGRGSPTLSEASTSSSVREIINRVARRSNTGSESDNVGRKPEESYLSVSPAMTGSTTVPMGSTSSRSKDNSEISDGSKVTFQQTFQASRSRNDTRLGDSSLSATSTLMNDSLSNRVQQLLNLTDGGSPHHSADARDTLSREDLIALVQVAELEKRLSESRMSQRPLTSRSSQYSQAVLSRDGISSSASAKDASTVSADSLALRVQAILGNEAPGERVDRIISEALSSVEQSVHDRNQSNMSVASKYSSAQSDVAPNASVTDLIERPFGAFDRARDMLTLHLQRLADRTFDHSVVTRTPVRQDDNANIVRTGEYQSPAINSSQQLSEHDFRTGSSGSITKPISSEHVFFGLLPEQIPSHLQYSQGQSAEEFQQLPVTSSPHHQYHSYPQYENMYQHNDNVPEDQDSQDIDDSLFAIPRSNSSPEIKVDGQMFPDIHAAAPSHHRSDAWGRQDQFEQKEQPLPASKLPVPSRSGAVRGQAYPQERQSGEYLPAASQTPQHLPSQKHQAVHQDYSTNSWPRSLSKARSHGGQPGQAEFRISPSTQAGQKSGKDSSMTEEFLRPYRPPGSSEVIYTYAVDGQGMKAMDGSPTVTNSTLESSHLGSDDAHAPSFPAGVYGTRPNQDSSNTAPHSSKIPRFDMGVTSPPRSPQDRSRTFGLAESKDPRSYRRSLSDSSRQEGMDKEKLSRQISLSPQHRPGRSRIPSTTRTSGLKREHSRSPPESVPAPQIAYDPRNERSGMHPRIGHTISLPLGNGTEPTGGVRRRASPERFGFGYQGVQQPPPQGWDPAHQGVPSGGAYPVDGHYRQQFVRTNEAPPPVPPTASGGLTSPSKIPRFRQGPDQARPGYAGAGSERRPRPVSYPQGRLPQYGARYGPEVAQVPQLPGTYSRQVLEDILQNESDPLYNEASVMWDQYQRLQQQKEARREARREVKGQELDSDVSSLDSRRVTNLARMVQDPVKHTVEQFVQDEVDSSSSTLTDSGTPRQRRRWDRQQGFTPREQSPDKLPRNTGFKQKVSPEEIAAVVRTSPTKESRIPRAAGRQNGQQPHDKDRRKDGKQPAKRSPTEEEMESSSSAYSPEDEATQELLSDLMTTQESLLSDISLESDRLLQLLGPDGVRKLSSKLVKLQRKIDRQREHHRKREEEKKSEQGRKRSGASQGQDDLPVTSTPAVDEPSSTSSGLEEVSDMLAGYQRLGKQASLEPCLSPVQEASIRSSEDLVYDTTESSPPEAPTRERKTANGGANKKHREIPRLARDVAHKDDFGVAYSTESLSEVGSESSDPCSCKPKRSHSIHGFTSRAREQATDNMSKETKMDVERDEVFKKPVNGQSRIPVRGSDPGSQTAPQRVKPGTAFVIDVGKGEKDLGTKDNVLTRRQNYNNKESEDQEDERRRRKAEKKAGMEKEAKENEAPSRIPTKIVQPVAWFQPLSKKMPWQQDTPSKEKPQPMSFPVKEEEPAAPKGPTKASLQEAFERHRSDFISKSRERQRKMKLAAEERHVQAQFELDRAQIFHDQRSKKPNPNAHPLSDQLHKPKKRAISRRQMREQTEKLYNRLPEVKQKEKEKKKVQDTELNRIRAQMYRKKLSDKVKGKPWTGT